MSSDPAFLFYPGDYLRDTQCLSEKTQVAYDRIICEHMRNICIRQRQLDFFIKRLSSDEKEELMMVLTKVNGGYQVKWVAESITKRRAYSKSRRENREHKNKKHMLTCDAHMENENEIEDTNAVIKEIIDDLNLVCGTHYKYSTPKTKELIKTRIKEGHTIAEFKVVHSNKAKEWMYDNKMVKFLRPETLYGNKFEGYLNQKEVKEMTKAKRSVLESAKKWQEKQNETKNI